MNEVELWNPSTRVRVDLAYSCLLYIYTHTLMFVLKNKSLDFLKKKSSNETKKLNH